VNVFLARSRSMGANPRARASRISTCSSQGRHHMAEALVKHCLVGEHANERQNLTGKRLAFELVFSVSIPLVPFSTCTGSMFDEDRRASACTLLRSRLGGCGRAEENAATATHHVAGPRGQPRRHERHRPYAYGLLDQRHLVRLQRRPSVVRERVQAKDGVGL